MSTVRDMLGSALRTDIERWARSLAYGVPMPNGDTLCRVLGEYMFVVTLDDHSVAPHLVMNGYWETWVTMCLAKRVKPGWQCVDVGANFGYFTVLLADLVGPTGKVEAWEPSEALFRRLSMTIALSGFKERIQVRPVAAGLETRRGSLYLLRKGHDYASATIVATYEAGTPEAYQEPAKERRIDTFTSLNTVDFVKLDAEGMEPEVWAGLGDIRPKAALIEWTPKRYTEPSAFHALLIGQGYTIGLVNSRGDVDPVTLEALLLVEDSEMLWIERA